MKARPGRKGSECQGWGKFGGRTNSNLTKVTTFVSPGLGGHSYHNLERSIFSDRQKRSLGPLQDQIQQGDLGGLGWFFSPSIPRESPISRWLVF